MVTKPLTNLSGNSHNAKNIIVNDEYWTGAIALVEAGVRVGNHASVAANSPSLMMLLPIRS